MNKRRRAKVTTGVGLVAMVFGAVVALAPFAAAGHQEGHTTGGGNLSCQQILSGLDVANIVTIKDDNQRNADFPTQTEGDEFHLIEDADETVSLKYRFVSDGSGGWEVEFKEATADIFGYQIKQADASRSQDGTFPDGVREALIPFGEGQFSHITFCSATPRDEDDTTLEIVKSVTGNAAPATWTFPFTADHITGSFDLTHTAKTTGAVDVTPDSAIVIEETDNKGATTSISCSGLATPATVDGLKVTVTLAEGEAGVCTYRNDYTQSSFTPPPPEETVETSSLQIIKAVEGGVPDEWTASFVGGLGAFDVNNVSVSHPVSGLTAGEYTVTEVDDPDSALTDIVCVGAPAVVDLTAASVTVDLDPGDSAQCTFTNTYPVVAGDVVVQEPEPEPEPEIVEEVEVEAEVVEVADETVVRALPRTGSGTERLAGLGIALMAFGAVLVAGSQRRTLRTT